MSPLSKLHRWAPKAVFTPWLETLSRKCTFLIRKYDLPKDNNACLVNKTFQARRWIPLFTNSLVYLKKDFVQLDYLYTFSTVCRPMEVCERYCIIGIKKFRKILRTKKSLYITAAKHSLKLEILVNDTQKCESTDRPKKVMGPTVHAEVITEQLTEFWEIHMDKCLRGTEGLKSNTGHRSIQKHANETNNYDISSI